MPLHQDILMILCEYGIIGMIYIYVFFVRKIKINIVLVPMVILFSFHNIVLAPFVACLFIITNSALNDEYPEKALLR